MEFSGHFEDYAFNNANATPAFELVPEDYLSAGLGFDPSNPSDVAMQNHVAKSEQHVLHPDHELNPTSLLLPDLSSVSISQNGGVPTTPQYTHGGGMGNMPFASKNGELGDMMTPVGDVIGRNGGALARLSVQAGAPQYRNPEGGVEGQISPAHQHRYRAAQRPTGSSPATRDAVVAEINLPVNGTDNGGYLAALAGGGGGANLHHQKSVPCDRGDSSCRSSSEESGANHLNFNGDNAPLMRGNDDMTDDRRYAPNGGGAYNQSKKRRRREPDEIVGMGQQQRFPRYDSVSGMLPSVSGDSSVSPSSSRDRGDYDRDTVMSLASMRVDQGRSPSVSSVTSSTTTASQRGGSTAAAPGGSGGANKRERKHNPRKTARRSSTVAATAADDDDDQPEMINGRPRDAVKILADRRKKHNEVESRRRQKISKNFVELKQMSKSDKADRGSILAAAITRLKHFEDTQIQHEAEIMRLKRELAIRDQQQAACEQAAKVLTQQTVQQKNAQAHANAQRAIKSEQDANGGQNGDSSDQTDDDGESTTDSGDKIRTEKDFAADSESRSALLKEAAEHLAAANSSKSGGQSSGLYGPGNSTAEDYQNHFVGSGVTMALVRPDGQFLDCNIAFEEMSGYSREELLKTNMFALTMPEDLPNMFSCVRSLISGGTVCKMVKRWVTKTGKTFSCCCMISVVRDPDTQQPKYFMCLGPPQGKAFAAQCEAMREKLMKENLTPSDTAPRTLG